VAIGLPNSAKVQGQLEPKALVGVLESVPVARHIPETAPVEASPRLGPLSLVVTDQNCCRVGGCIDEVVRYGVDPWSLTSHTTQTIARKHDISLSQARALMRRIGSHRPAFARPAAIRSHNRGSIANPQKRDQKESQPTRRFSADSLPRFATTS
jgi:hypothetical protein